MKNPDYDIVIDRISEPLGSHTGPGYVEVHHHLEGGPLEEGVRDGFEVTRINLTPECLNEDGTPNEDEIYRVVRSVLGETEPSTEESARMLAEAEKEIAEGKTQPLDEFLAEGED